tara:strand:- start:761 stop:1399 length:639 start_codon:yes stop_codon:yes gene_type:complete
MKQEGEEMKNEKPEAVNEHAGIGMNGHILIRDKETGEELVNKRNAIHYGNMANLVANALNNQAQSYIHFMAFGNGGTSVDTAGKVVYKSPRVSESFEASADLYSRSYSKVISAAASDPSTDKIEVIAGSSFTDLKITCTLGFAEPNDQDLFDSSTDNDGSYVFDELALYSYPTDLTTGITTSKMLTHVVFHPVQKSQNRIIEIIYTVRIQLS